MRPSILESNTAVGSLSQASRRLKADGCRARLVCDWIANMTDRFAFRTYRRLFDAEFGSITDFV